VSGENLDLKRELELFQEDAEVCFKVAAGGGKNNGGITVAHQVAVPELERLQKLNSAQGDTIRRLRKQLHDAEAEVREAATVSGNKTLVVATPPEEPFVNANQAMALHQQIGQLREKQNDEMQALVSQQHETLALAVRWCLAKHCKPVVSPATQSSSRVVMSPRCNFRKQTQTLSKHFKTGVWSTQCGCCVAPVFPKI